jgi:uncharacterized Fe-S cluster-containing radical SAM superfamily protein
VFCAADLGGPVPLEIRRPSLTLERITEWFGDRPPGPGDRVALSGGEPTLHRELLDIAAYVSGRGADVALFTNGLRLANESYAQAVVRSGVSRFEISLFGDSPESHDAITRRAGSYAKTIAALRNLTEIRRSTGIVLSVRLLVSRQTHERNPGIAEAIFEAGVEPDWLNLNKVILSEDAISTGAPISWSDARGSVNETIRTARRLGLTVSSPTLPWCVLDDDNLRWLRGTSPVDALEADARVEYRYLDPLQNGSDARPAPRYRPALPDPCVVCAAAPACARVEQGYLGLFGTQGLSPLHDDAVQWA